MFDVFDLTNLKNDIDPGANESELGLNFENKTDWINESYFSYLNRYSNNLVYFSEPKSIDLNVSNDTFKLLFEEFVFSLEDYNKPNKHPVKRLFLFNSIEALTARISHNSFPAAHTREKIVFILPDRNLNDSNILNGTHFSLRLQRFS